MKHRAVSDIILAGSLEVHRELGPGLLESSYEIFLCHELARRGVAFKRQVSLPIEYKGEKLACGFRVDLIVEDVVIVELKSVECLLPVHKAQLLAYMRHSGMSVGLLLNFNTYRLRDGLVRMVL